MAGGRVLGWLTQAFRKGQPWRRGPVLGVDEPAIEPEAVTPRPIELLAADLRRLGQESVRLHSDPRVPARAFRLCAVELAYDDTLLMACRALEVETEGATSPLPAVRRLEVECELARRGLEW
jgi:hypothetical protein